MRLAVLVLLTLVLVPAVLLLVSVEHLRHRGAIL